VDVGLALLAVPLAVLPLLVFSGLIIEHTRRAQARPSRYLIFTAASWLIGLLATCGGGITLFDRTGDADNWVILLFILVGGPVGTTAGPGMVYLLLRMRTVRDPDYGPLDPEESGPAKRRMP
jgi:hypothetical protein